MNTARYDVIIVGSSFAGLAAADSIQSANVLLIDVKPPGEGIKSACGTVLDTVSSLGLSDYVSQVHEKMVLHTAYSNLVFKLKSPFCVINSEMFCRAMFGRSGADFLQDAVLKIKNGVVITKKSAYGADIIVDAAGPNAVFGVANRHVSFGIETVVNYREQGLHFWYEPRMLPKGVFWIFPQGATSRIGAASYIGETNLISKLDAFMARYNLKRGNIHGGYFPHRMHDPVNNSVFLVGDSAGHCVPLTGEGIRPALYFGRKLGEVINDILKKKVSFEEGVSAYKKFVFKRRKIKYEFLYGVQKFFTNIPQIAVYACAWVVSRQSVMDFVLKKYLKIVENEK